MDPRRLVPHVLILSRITQRTAFPQPRRPAPTWATTMRQGRRGRADAPWSAPRPRVIAGHGRWRAETKNRPPFAPLRAAAPLQHVTCRAAALPQRRSSVSTGGQVAQGNSLVFGRSRVPRSGTRLPEGHQMTCKRLLVNIAIHASAIFLVLAACAHSTTQSQERLPPRTQDRPLQDRIKSGERSERESWQKRDEVVRALALKDGDVVADGKVYAVDVAADVLGYLEQQAGHEGLGNVATIVSREDDPMLPANAVDLAFFCDTTHHIANRTDFYRRMLPGLKEHGRLAIIDYPPGAEHAPHPPEQLVPRSQAIGEAEEAGFKLVDEFNFLPRQYFLLFEKR